MIKRLAFFVGALILSGCTPIAPNDLIGEYQSEGYEPQSILSLRADGTATLTSGLNVEHFDWVTSEQEPGCLRIDFEPIGTAREWHPCAEKALGNVFITHRESETAFYKKSANP